jgi:hypothetical protein
MMTTLLIPEPAQENTEILGGRLSQVVGTAPEKVGTIHVVKVVLDGQTGTRTTRREEPPRIPYRQQLLRIAPVSGITL